MAEPRPKDAKDPKDAKSPEKIEPKAQKGTKDEAASNLRAVADDPSEGASPVTPGRPIPAQAAPAAERKGSRLGLWLLLLVAVAAAVAALVQTQRLQQTTARATALSEQVIGLEAQLAAASTQIATYEMQRGQIRDAVGDISQRVLLLSELVADDAAPNPPVPGQAP